MPKYQYCCDDCSGKKLKKFDGAVGIHSSTKEYLFVIECSMKEKPNKPKCPNCGGSNTHASFTDYNNECWIRGDGLVKDRAGARRDMNKHHLVNGDPYGHMRQSGEVDHLLNKIRRAGMDMNKVMSSSRKNNYEIAKKVKNQSDDLSEIQLEIIKIIGESGAEYSRFSNIDDPNAVLSSLMPDYIIKNKDGVFVLMALGRKVFSEFTEGSKE